MRQGLIVLLFFFLFVSRVSGESGILSIASAHDVKSTADRFEKTLEEKGMTLFGRINHADAARNVGQVLRPTELIVFGNPKVGTRLMQCAQSIAIDLPQKALIWEDEKGKVWFSYNDPGFLAKRHDFQECADVIQKISGVLNRLALSATRP